MKSIILFFIFTFSALSVWSQTRSEEQMQDIALDVLYSNQSARIRALGDMSENDKLQILCNSNDILGVMGAPSFYVYGYRNGTPGFVIVSADEQTHAVLGYSTDEIFSYSDLPSSAREMLSLYDRRMHDESLTTALLSPQEGFAHSRKSAPANQIAPLLGDICFSQREPYNRLCPEYEGQRCLTGCTATAMSMIMKYYEYPSKMSSRPGIISYSTSRFPSLTWNTANVTFDWKNICDTYDKPAVYANEVLTREENILVHAGLSTSDYDGYLKINYLTNVSGSVFNGDIQLLIANESGKFLSPGSAAKVESDFASRNYYSSYHISPTMPASLPDGTYRIYIACKPKGAYMWTLVKKALSNSVNDRYNSSTYERYYVTAQKHGNTFTILGQDMACGYSDTEAKAVANLCAACAYSLHADFGVESTSGNVINMGNALIDAMTYSDHMTYTQPMFFSTQGWHTYLQSELTARRPLFISGHSGTNGHAFVIDGYQYKDGVPYYHVNWGWNGKSNGYFLIDYLKPSEAGDGGYETNYGEEIYVIANIKPQSTIPENHYMGATDIKLSKNNVREWDYLDVDISRLTSCTFGTINGNVYLIAKNSHGDCYKVGLVHIINDLNCRFYWEQINATVSVPNTIPSGVYSIGLGINTTGDNTWNEVFCPTAPVLQITNLNPTGIEDIDAHADAISAYDLFGRPAQTPHRGQIVISGGKKHIVR